MFSDVGYHATSMEAIAAAEGITAAALYRHFPNKYALFTRCSEILSAELLAGVAEVPAGASLEDVLAPVVRVTLENRDIGGIYRWESRYLEPDDRRLLRSRVEAIVGRIAEAIAHDRAATSGSEAPPGNDFDVDLRARTALGAIGSITMHHTPFPTRRLAETLRNAAVRVANVPLDRVSTRPALTPPTRPAPVSRREEILAAAIPLFDEDGFTAVTMSRIAESVGLAQSALYRHYPGKVDILAAACLHAAGLLADSVERALPAASTPLEAVQTLSSAFVAYSFEHTALTNVAGAEVAGLPDTMRAPVIDAQRRHVLLWTEHLLRTRPELDPREARILVHAALGVVLEGGRALRWRDTPVNRATVEALLLAALGLPAAAV